MSQQFKLGLLIQEYIDENITEEGTIPKERRKGFLLEVARMIQYDATFERSLLEKTTSYIEAHYPNIALWENHQGTLPNLDAVTEEMFDAECEMLEKNFSHERVAWLKQAGQKLYGKPKNEKVEDTHTVGEPQKSAIFNDKQKTSKPRTEGSGFMKLAIVLVMGIMIIASLLNMFLGE